MAAKSNIEPAYRQELPTGGGYGAYEPPENDGLAVMPKVYGMQPALFDNMNIDPAGDIIPYDPNRSLADRVFGRQLVQGALTMAEAQRLARERERMHRRHLDELDRWHNDLLNRLSIARRPYSVATPQQVNQLERQFFQVETSRQREDLAFWQDMAEVYKNLIDASFEYRAVRDRYGLVGDLERSDG